MEEEGSVSKSLALTACASMAIFYVAVLHAPTVLLRLPPATSFRQFTLRRFYCAAVSTVASVVLTSLLLPLRRNDSLSSIAAFGIRMDHIWQAVIFPLLLTSLMYSGSLVWKSLVLVDFFKSCGGSISSIKSIPENFVAYFSQLASNILAWRNYVVAPITEEFVFRACMVPLLLSGGFSVYIIVFLSPIFFSLAHLSHLFEFYGGQNRSLVKALMVVGIQLGYTVVFGSYATFIFTRTGHLLAPVVAHVFCNIMGLPVMFSRRNGLVAVAFVAGVVAFFWLLFPLTSPDLYNERRDSCRCWQAYCMLN